MFPYEDPRDWCYDHCCLAICLAATGFLILAGAIVCITLFLNHIPYSHMKFYVNGASLTEFYLTDDNILHYNLSVNISVRNSNKVTRIIYHRIRSNPSCYGKDLPWVPLPSFQQGTKNTSLLHPVYQGQASLILRGSRLKDFNYDQMDGSYSISVYLYLETKLKLAGGGKERERERSRERDIERSKNCEVADREEKIDETGKIRSGKNCEVAAKNRMGSEDRDFWITDIGGRFKELYCYDCKAGTRGRAHPSSGTDDLDPFAGSMRLSSRDENLIMVHATNIISYGEYLGSVSLPSFWQNTKNTTLLHPVFQGQTLVKLRGSRLRDFNYDQRDGNYSISVYLYVETELKHAGGGKSGFNGMEVECGLFRLHLLGSSSSSSSNQTGIGSLFKTKRCKVYYDNDDSYY
ncbi:hypothetical protein C5167_040609 [Papaver somniferum]|uniref:Late embryogenesis abundant protein LEA-2 subgroup domain-containing protein n=1 Tax=Papaver somniferum TaxID=3469 RepID=A0A4Y7IFK2_PAPSO|nr:hypothetical protein C5167_040609 [Papaver somniferum]